ncbi:MAG TPA: phosphatase PAP2 family protein [Methylomusa anaerophila]|uniref:Phosphatidylglycerophosphatase B n=1 Tax=Methylomusa anaerophila TaxID=1930071 RepID=A0A348ANB6_9FIRM|nr:phosphatase PAP2 family protein [Methylomusa anaerophila]BBB92564.1 phosphatidylglycerophosphatase B [Methylomusa anaerophila]HML87581.1 phosphatase PAP2 family protein [Methylomusa anaerophila]
MERVRRYAILVCLLLAGHLAIAYGAESVESPAVFSHGDIHIAASRVIERLMVAGADATVRGTVKESIVIIDGNLHLAPTARIRESVIVLGGHVEREVGSEVEGYLIAVPPQGFPMLKLLTVLLFLLAILSLIALPLLAWLIFHMGQRFPAYRVARDWLLNIQRRWPLLYIVLTLGFSCSMLVLFMELAWKTIFRHAMGVFDSSIIWLVRYFATPALDRVMVSISDLGFGFSYAAIVVTVFAALAVYRRWLEVEGLTLSFAGGAVLNYVLKNLFERARPDAFHLVAAAGYSFPSGHAMVSLCFYGMLAFLLARTVSSWRWRYFLVIVTVLLVIAIGISRIYLGVHYPSDVVAGYTGGTMWLMFCISLLMLGERKRRKVKI